jgi:hypothetical protein
VHGRQLVVPYGISDYATTFATIPLAQILAANGMVDLAGSAKQNLHVPGHNLHLPYPLRFFSQRP